MNKNTIEYQKMIADEVMSKLETFDPTCILAGGAPRDWYFGNLATDLDFFVYFRPDFAGQMWRYAELLETLGFRMERKGSKSANIVPPNYKRNPYLICVYEQEYKGVKIQVMFMNEKTFTSAVPQFPFGICQAWYKPGFGINTSAEFDYSVKHKLLTLLNDLYNDADGYVEKIRSKFPDYDYLGRK